MVWSLKTRFFAIFIATGGSLARKLKLTNFEPLWHLFTKFHRNRPVDLGCGASLYKHFDRNMQTDDFENIKKEKKENRS